MRIALVIESFDPADGGNERSTAQIADELCQRGHEVTILAGYAPRPDLMEPVTVETMALGKSSSWLRLLRFARWARQRLETGGYDVSLSVTMAVPAHVVQPRGGMVKETLQRNIAMRRTPWRRLVKTVGLWLNPKQQLLLWLERRTLADAGVQAVVAVSGYVVDQVRRHYPAAADRVQVIHNGAVMPVASPPQRDHWRQQIRGRYGVSDQAVVYVFAATNPRLKGYDTLLRAAKRLTQRGIDPVLLIAGSAFPMSQLRLVNALGLRDHVRIIGPTRQMPALYAAADVTVLPTWYDPSSKVVLESLMMGTPAISTACNGASDFIEGDEGGGDGGGRRGRVIEDPADDAALADAMAELADPAARAACTAACRGMEQLLSMSRHVDRLEAVLAEAAGGGVGRAGRPDVLAARG